MKVISFSIHSNCLATCGFFMHAPHFGNNCFRQPPALLHWHSQKLNPWALHSKFLLGVTSSKFPLLSLLDHFCIYSLMVEERCHSCICSCFLCLPASSNYATFCIICAVRTAELAGRQQRGAKQLYGPTAHQQEPKKIGRKGCCWSITCFLVFPHFLTLGEEPDKVYGEHICICLGTKRTGSKAASQDPSGRVAFSNWLSKPLSVGIVLAQCPGGTPGTTETLSPSVTTMATSKSLGSLWPHWWVHSAAARLGQPRGHTAECKIFLVTEEEMSFPIVR